MKKMIALVLALCCLTAFACAEDVAQVSVSGKIDRMNEDCSFILITQDGTSVQVNISEDTVLEGTEELYAGLYVQVDYDGKLMKSSPAQLNADRVTSFFVTGTVSGVAQTEEGNPEVTLETLDMGQVIFTLPMKDAYVPEVGDTLRVFHDGTMTLSLPAHLHALYVEKVFFLTGTVLSVTDGVALVDCGDAGQVEMTFAPGLTLPVEAEEGVFSYNGIMSRSIPAQVTVFAWETVAPEKAR